MKPFAILCALALLAVPGAVAAQDQTEFNEIVVTASRISGNDYDDAVSVQTVPAVTVTRRADNLIVSVWVVNDTREAVARRNELIQTLRSMVRSAGSQPDIALSVADDASWSPSPRTCCRP